ncbi:hypothetical protein HMPREF9477_00882 [Lachnospiraceae bacterium 2_1_46FAA]|nr:hypothetical protein HMPREF9477_00882 [Lachnospiraceae bacterium 2_1_46FAA]
MREEKVLRTCKIVRKITVIIGLAVTILPILFWNYIPDKIPAHYGVSGKVDRVGGKEELILLFFVLWLVLGSLSVVSYYLKTSGVSKYANEKDNEHLQTIYPMITWITLITTFTPIVVYIGKARKHSAGNPSEKAKFVQAESREEGIAYRTAVDWWLALLFILVIGGELWIFFQSLLNKGKVEWITLVAVILILLLVVPLVRIKYILYSEHFLISAGYLGKQRIAYSSIVNIKETHNPLSAPACSLDRVEIDYVVSGMHKFALISPVHLKMFKKELESRCEK